MIEPNSPLARAYGWATETLDALLQASNDLLRMVAGGGPATLHTIAAVLAEREAIARAHPVAWADRLAHLNRGLLLQEVYGQVPEGFQPALAKLGPMVAPRETYRMLIAALAVPAFLPVLRRRLNVCPALVALLATPEAQLLNTKLLTRLPLDDADAVDALREALVLRTRTAPWSEHLDELRICGEPQALLGWFRYKWEQPFPTPPWSGDELLMPITDAELQRQLGTEMRNCLATQVLEVGRGSTYYYITRTPPRIAVELRLRAGRWYATQILEARNRRPKPEERREVLKHLMQANIPVDLDDQTCMLLERALGLSPEDRLGGYRLFDFD